ncbi:hypothetical protein FVQ98_17735 [Ottowia sp. GY511]|uniref:DUF3617 family protein n=1 Tax=Ottowia flava TaxID=2675430 RepID=A0ABW4KVG6_9BURK|nr:hypothetical protein [Ottowia sp. GY511]TXK23298.1 hypothetical protein FVQ98_17735 [Ottowia sp. GY511]
MSPLRLRAALAGAWLVALLTLGCGARAVTAQAPGTAPTAVQAPPTVATEVLPASVQGRWTPVSKALEAPGPLTLTAQSLTWKPCGAVARSVQGQTSGNAVQITLPGQAGCRLGDDVFTLLRIAPRAGKACEMELSLYANAAQLAKQQRLAWGVYERQGCQPQ